jgi:hypothetical protein
VVIEGMTVLRASIGFSSKLKVERWSGCMSAS